MKHIYKTLLLALILLVSAQTAVQSQTYSLPGDGKDFFLGFMFPSYNKVAHPAVVAYYGAYALVSSFTDNNHVTVSYFDRQTGQEQTNARYVIPGRTGIQIPLDISSMLMNDTGDVPEFCACHIVGERPINIEFFSTGACSGGSYLPITTAGLGKKYVAASYQDNPGELGILCYVYAPKSIETSEGFFEIVAAFDGTCVTIIPNSTTMGGHLGMHSGKGANLRENAYTVCLRRGQCYLVKSSGDNTDVDISGSIIESNKPIAVIAGHENASIGGVSNRLLEGRDFMIEQMYPYDFWDTTGYVMIPLKDSQPADGSTFDGVGEDYRMFSLDSTASKINFFDACISGAINMTSPRLAFPAPERTLVTCPIDIEATNGIKFSAMMYDERNFANAPPYPAPSMITVIPMSRWRTSFLWYVPANKFENLQAYYVNIIAPPGDFDGPTGILASFNGGTIRPIKTVLGLEQQFKNIPNHIQGVDPAPLTGVRFRLSPGSYYAKGPHPFMVYNFGFRALDPNNDLGDFDCDDYFFSYGLPVGIKLGGGVQHIRVVVDTFCSYWNVCAYDSTLGLSNQGIKSVTLLDDPNGDFVQPPEESYNTALVDSVNGINTSELDYTGDDTSVCFKVTVLNPIDSAYAALFIVDDNNNATIFRLHYTPPIVQITPDSGQYLLVALYQDSCSRYVFYNTGKTVLTHDTIYTIGKNGDTTGHRYLDTLPLIHSGKPFTFSSDKLKDITDTNFKVMGPVLPVTVNVGDSLVFTVCFTPNDTNTRKDTLELVNDCFTAPIPLIGSGKTPIIIADDHDFGSVLVDSTKCAQVNVKNVGNAPLVLTKQWLMDHYGVNFTFPDSSMLPYTLNPGAQIKLTFCFTPHAEEVDSTVQHWGTNLQDPYLHQKKDYSVLIGKGVRSGFVWDRVIQLDTVICEDTVVNRVYLLNNAAKGGPDAHVNTVTFTGVNATDFYILNDQIGKLPLVNFDLAGGDSIWVDVVFKPNLALPPAQKYADRFANLVASGAPEKDQIINFTGTILHAIPNVIFAGNIPGYNDSLFYGFVSLNTQITRSFTLQNFGDAPLVINSFFPVTPPIISVTGIAPGTILPPHDTTGVLVQVTMALTAYADTVVVLNIASETECTDTMKILNRIASTQINPQNTGHPFPETFLECRQLVDSIQALNIGTQPLTLKQIDIIAANPGEQPTEFAFPGDPTPQTLIVGKVFPVNYRQNFAVLYRPTIEGPVSATIRCTWDSLGKIVYSSNILTGIGKLERDTIVPVITTPSQAPNWITGSSINVQVNFSGFSKDTVITGNTLTTIPDLAPGEVQAGGMSFSVTYRQDLLNYIPGNVTYDPSVAPLSGSNPTGVADGKGNETVTFVLKSKTGTISQKIPPVNLQYEVMVARDYSSPITVSNAYFWGATPADSLCYVISETGSTVFVPNPSCGDSTLRNKLNGNMPTKIVSITPNPTVSGGIPIVTFEVNVDKIPLTVQVYNALGVCVGTVERDQLHSIGEYNLPIGTANLPSGMYVVRITSPSSVESGEFLIQK